MHDVAVRVGGVRPVDEAPDDSPLLTLVLDGGQGRPSVYAVAP